MRKIFFVLLLALGIIFSIGLANAALSNPDIYWKFNETNFSSTASDSSGVRNFTIASQNTSFISGKLGNALAFSGAINNLSASASASSNFSFDTGNFTIAFWINTSLFATSYQMIETDQNDNGWSLAPNVNGTLSFDNNNAELGNTKSNITGRGWQRIVITREGTGANKFRFWVNGTNTANYTLAANISNSTTDLVIRRMGGANLLMIDDFRIYKDYAWTASDVSTDWNNGDGQEASGAVPGSILVTLNAPANNTQTSNTSIIFNATLVPTNINLTNATIRIYNTTTVIFNSTRNLITGNISNTTTWNITGFKIGTYFWDVEGCGINQSSSAVCAVAGNRTLIISSVVNSNTFNASTYETMRESFSTNFTILPGSTISTANLFYNGTSHSGAITNIGGNDRRLSAAINIPTVSTTTTKNWFWSVNYEDNTQENLTVNTQTVGAINLSICGASPQNIPYINFTFKNESGTNNLNASVDASTWVYYLGTGDVNKTLTYSNIGSNANYTFCFSPQNKTVLTTLNFKYSSAGFPQRTYNPSTLTLTNTTTNTILYMLQSADGIYTSIQAAESSGSTISGVYITIERQIDNVWTTIETGTTDSSGLVTFWVNPNFDHRITATKSGYATAQVTIRPSQSTYTLTMSKSGAGATHNDSLEGMKWIIFPSTGRVGNGSLLYGMNLTASLGNLESCKMELVRSDTDAILTSVTGTGAYGCNISLSYTIPTDVRIFGKFYIDTTGSSGFFLIDGDALWYQFETNGSAWTQITSFFEELKNIPEFGEGQLRKEYTYTILFFFVLLLVLGVLTFYTEFDRVYPGFFIVIVCIMVFFASKGGLLTYDFGNPDFPESLKQYAVFFINFLYTSGYLLNRFARDS